MQKSKWGKQVKLLCVLCVLLPLLSGCWDRLEIEERSAILGLAVDLGEPEEEKEEPKTSHLGEEFPKPPVGLIHISAQIAVPGRLPLGPGEGGGGGGGGAAARQKPVWVVSAVGHTLDDAMSNLQQQLANRLFFGHLRVIVISEKLAKKGVQNINDYLRRNPEVRRLAWMVVSKGKASEAMQASPELERLPTLYLLATLEHAIQLGKFPTDFLGIFWSSSSKKGQEPFLPIVEIKKEQTVEISGLAYFKGDKMVGVTKPLEIGYYMATMGINPGGYTAVVPVPGTTSTVMFHSKHRKSKILVDLKNGQPHVTVKVRVDGDLEEKSNEKFSIAGPERIDEIQKELEKRAMVGFKDLVKKTQEQGSDIYGFGEYFRSQYPKYWNQQIKTKSKWGEVYQEIPVDFEVTYRIRRVGMKGR